jgi:hypothetical protein
MLELLYAQKEMCPEIQCAQSLCRIGISSYVSEWVKREGRHCRSDFEGYIYI